MSGTTKVIITGGNGFVGQHLRRELEENWSGAEIISWDRVKSAEADHAASLPIDITKPETYSQQLRELQPDWVVHLAAIAKVGGSNGQEEKYSAVNVEGSKFLLQAIKDNSPTTKVLVASSSDIYGVSDITTSGSPVLELALEDCKPANPYAQSKLDMEKMIVEEFNDFVIRVRPFPHIGPGQGEGFVTADFAKQIAEIEKTTPSSPSANPPLLRKEGKILVGNLEAKRDFTDVRDVVRAYRLLMEAAEAVPRGEQSELFGVYNIASGNAVSIQEILDKLLELSSVEIVVDQDPSRMRPADIPVLVGDATKLASKTNWQPEIKLEQSLQEILDYWRNL